MGLLMLDFSTNVVAMQQNPDHQQANVIAIISAGMAPVMKTIASDLNIFEPMNKKRTRKEVFKIHKMFSYNKNTLIDYLNPIFSGRGIFDYFYNVVKESGIDYKEDLIGLTITDMALDYKLQYGNIIANSKLFREESGPNERLKHSLAIHKMQQCVAVFRAIPKEFIGIMSLNYREDYYGHMEYLCDLCSHFDVNNDIESLKRFLTDERHLQHFLNLGSEGNHFASPLAIYKFIKNGGLDLQEEIYSPELSWRRVYALNACEQIGILNDHAYSFIMRSDITPLLDIRFGKFGELASLIDSSQKQGLGNIMGSIIDHGKIGALVGAIEAIYLLEDLYKRCYPITEFINLLMLKIIHNSYNNRSAILAIANLCYHFMQITRIEYPINDVRGDELKIAGAIIEAFVYTTIAPDLRGSISSLHRCLCGVIPKCNDSMDLLRLLAKGVNEKISGHEPELLRDLFARNANSEHIAKLSRYKDAFVKIQNGPVLKTVFETIVTDYDAQDIF